MNTRATCQDYCIGCGLCKSVLSVPMEKNAKGFLKPDFKNTDDEIKFLEKVCPVVSENVAGNKNDLWGYSLGSYLGYDCDNNVREKASSGGVLTAIAIHLLEKNKIDGVIQICADRNDQIETEVVISTSKEEVMQCCGSRYSISSPWAELNSKIDPHKKYAAIAKPCDIRALRNLQEKEGIYSNIVYLFSFFCAGLPSIDANKKLIKALGCENKNVTSLTYRGNGWPGTTTAIDEDKNEYKMDYSSAWGGILGRDINPFCRLCFDGIGEAADIACGDGWYVDKNNQPDFSEHDGRNIIFARTEKGLNLLKEMQMNSGIALEPFDDYKYLEAIQNYQYTRKITMKTKLTAYKLFGRRTPRYDRKRLKIFSKEASAKLKLKIFLGTAKRIVLKKI